MGRSQQRVSQLQTLPAPTGGINDIDPVAAMGAQYCLDLINLYPTTSDLSIRPGYRQHAINLEGKVFTLMRYIGLDGEQELFAVTGTGIYDVTLSTDAPVKVASVSNGVMNHKQFSNVAGTYLIACNGVDPVIMYNGTDWITWVESETPEAPGEITGVDPSNLFGVLPHKGRLWFIQKDSMTAWYLDTDAVGGTATAFRLGGQFGRGGALYQMATWSLDSGAGMDDKLIFHTNVGEVAIYAGTDPASADSWSLESVFFTSGPIGTKANSELGGDVLLMTQAGVIPLSTLVEGQLNVAVTESTVSKRVSRTLNSLVKSVYYIPDWEIHNVPSLQATVIVIPATTGSDPVQFVMNNLTGAWTKFDMPARSFAVFRGDYMFGTDDGMVCLGGRDTLDNIPIDDDGEGGDPIQNVLFSAFNYLGDPTVNKHFKLVRPIFSAGSPPSFLLKVNVDYDQAEQAGSPPAAGGGRGIYLWDNALWDDAFWASSTAVYRPWTGVTGMGFCAAVLMKITSEEATSIAAFEIAFEPGASI